ncbi:MAG: hypothetical protein Q9183_002713, partial [Haloplaca sp. 2 TL-2023]
MDAPWDRKNTIGLCRASKVDTAQVGAHLEAYVQSKGLTTCFRACVRHAAYDSALSKIPVEVSSLIQDFLHDSIYYNGMIESWHKIMSCVNNTCGHREGLSRVDDDTSDEDDESDGTGSGDQDGDDESNPEDSIASDSEEMDTNEVLRHHYDTVTTFLDNITECIDERPPNSFTKYRR